MCTVVVPKRLDLLRVHGPRGSTVTATSWVGQVFVRLYIFLCGDHKFADLMEKRISNVQRPCSTYIEAV